MLGALRRHGSARNERLSHCLSSSLAQLSGSSFVPDVHKHNLVDGRSLNFYPSPFFHPYLRLEKILFPAMKRASGFLLSATLFPLFPEPSRPFSMKAESRDLRPVFRFTDTRMLRRDSVVVSLLNYRRLKQRFPRFPASFDTATVAAARREPAARSLRFQSRWDFVLALNAADRSSFTSNRPAKDR